MTTESQTPRTDALARSYTDGSLFALARTLERELVAAKRSLAIADETIIDKASENARLREALGECADWLENAHEGSHPWELGKQARAALVQS